MKRRFSYIKNTRRLVVKVGSNLITKDNGLDIETLESVSRQISVLMDRGLEVILVTSGAMSAGMRKMKMSGRPDEIPLRQAISAIGQAGLINEYENAFAHYDRKVAQILLTGDGLTHRKRYLNARNTLHTLLSWGVVPIINENDTISVKEIQFGDNDNLSAIITLQMDADLLINLTDIDGLYSSDPRSDKNAKYIAFVERIDKKILDAAGSIPGALGTGGMGSKIRAARKVTSVGIPMIIANGRISDIVLKICDGENYGTFFVPKKEKMNNRKRWIGYTAKPKGCIRIDEGAVKAILRGGKSLLPSGIIEVIGEFGIGSAAEIIDREDRTIAAGLVNYTASDIRKIMGLKTDRIRDRLGEKPYDEVIHRDNLVITIEN